ncbi:MAG TPA: DUF5335 family protein [Ignavibacteriales bacterium]|nr:DUF5335 family protein [Ignavibacteriales bacterium]
MTREVIPENEWVVFFHDFTKANRDKIITIEVYNDRKEKIDEVTNLPLREVNILNADKENSVAQVIAGLTSSVSHFIDKTKEVILEKTGSGNPKTLYINSSLGRGTVIYFHSMAE